MEAARRELGGHARVGQWSTQKQLLARPTLGIVERPRAAEAEELELAVRLRVGKSQQAFDSEIPALEVDLFEQHIEAIARLEVAIEIEIPLQNVGHGVSELRIGTGRSDRTLERSRNRSVDGAGAEFPPVGAPRRQPLFAATLNRQFTLPSHRELESVRLVAVEVGRDAHPGLKLPGVHIAARSARRELRLVTGETQIAQRFAQGVAGAQGPYSIRLEARDARGRKPAPPKTVRRAPGALDPALDLPGFGSRR